MTTIQEMIAKAKEQKAKEDQIKNGKFQKFMADLKEKIKEAKKAEEAKK